MKLIGKIEKNGKCKVFRQLRRVRDVKCWLVSVNLNSLILNISKYCQCLVLKKHNENNILQ